MEILHPTVLHPFAFRFHSNPVFFFTGLFLFVAMRIERNLFSRIRYWKFDVERPLSIERRHPLFLQHFPLKFADGGFQWFNNTALQMHSKNRTLLILQYNAICFAVQKREEEEKRSWRKSWCGFLFLQFTRLRDFKTAILH